MTAPRPRPVPTRMRLPDIARLGGAGLRARPLRAVLSALGIAIGIAAMVAVLGISASSRAQLQSTLDRLGTNLLTVGPGQTLFGEQSYLPDASVGMVARIGPVTSATATGRVSGAHVYRNDHIPSGQTGGISVLAARTDLLDAVRGTVASGTWLNAATARYPAVVLGADAAKRAGHCRAGRLAGGDRPAGLRRASDDDLRAVPGRHRAGGVGRASADGEPAAPRGGPGQPAVRRAGGQGRGGQHADRPAARPRRGRAAGRRGGGGQHDGDLGAGAPSEVGLRRSLGATRGQIRGQFLTESLLLSGLGGAAGAVIGGGVTTGYALWRGWPVAVPPYASIGGVAATLLIGGVAGLYPAVRAARVSPSEALATP